MTTLKQARRFKGITQKTLAGLIGVSPGQISAWERGLDEPKLINTQKLCKALEIDIADIEFAVENNSEELNKLGQESLITMKLLETMSKSTVVSDPTHDGLDIVQISPEKAKPKNIPPRLKFTNPSYEDTWNIRFVDPYRLDHQEPS
ncbi:MAG: helix-turn-helix transcriptional regulator [Chloroflexota bacterium]|nr:helix-turn-helix transcriptional regulator [Chloroflexota bacterium]